MPTRRAPTIDVSQAESVRTEIARSLMLLAFQRQAKPKSERGFTPLRQFVREAWHIIEPGTALSWNWHMDDICDHLEAITFGVLGRFDEWQPYEGRPQLTQERYERLRNLVINVPPRSTKSIIISVCWPAWAWAEVDPGLRWLFSSYSLALSLDHSRLCRDIIESEWYQDRYADRYRLRHDLNTASDFANSKGGRRQAISVGSATTGKGGDILVADDPHNVIEGESEADRATVRRWYGQAFSTRLNNPATGAKVVVMQRIHQQDLSGELLGAGSKWERLIYRQEYEPATDGDGNLVAPHETALGYTDRRSQDGELLWPERFTAPVVANAKVELGSYGYAGQHQQRPSPLEGGIFHRDWWQRFSLAAHRNITFRRLAIFVDTATKDKATNDYSVFLLAGMDALNDYYFLDLWRGKVESPALIDAAYDFWIKHAKLMGKALPLIVEDKGNGSSLIQHMRKGEVMRDLSLGEYSQRLAVTRPKVPAMAFQGNNKSQSERMLSRWINMDKVTKAQSISPIVQSGRVWIPNEAEWAADFLTETSDFPNAPNDDQVDVGAMAIKWLSGDVDKTLRGSN